MADDCIMGDAVRTFSFALEHAAKMAALQSESIRRGLFDVIDAEGINAKSTDEFVQEVIHFVRNGKTKFKGCPPKQQGGPN